MVGADDATFAQLKPVLSAYCENVIHVGGPPGHGHMLKLVNNFLGDGDRDRDRRSMRRVREIRGLDQRSCTRSSRPAA